ncbi:DUF3611 domain containing protein [Nitzschia inconspicua]|uniref:DUF3611 domain containing protein n=1 Tax=Nitzschia inconspicua TaxID=303405 RepID=A0A9K3PIB4_9STRA|nr:DUF3611 domain containing protein [Nitzschia inconspicua]
MRTHTILASAVLIHTATAFLPTIYHATGNSNNQCPLPNNLSKRQSLPIVLLPTIYPIQSNNYLSKRNAKGKNGKQFRNNNNNNGKEEEDFGDEMVVRRPKLDALVEVVSLRIRRISWLSWWSQVILTTVASITLLFTRNVMNAETAMTAASAAFNRSLLPNYFLAGSSISLGFISIFWTWATRRLSRRLLRKPTTRIQAANMIRKDIHVGTVLNLLGMAFALLGAEQIVGGLAIKVLTTTTNATPAVYQGAQAVSLLQPLDILVVQANTNTLFSHFCSLIAFLWLGRSIDKLDPPSRDDSPRSG